ncbi:MAG: FkbM family methyltransferase [Alphaproteobacteria bacterium]|jgi:FkbM family methyltransferase
MGATACTAPPWWFEVAAKRINADKRGGWALMKAFQSLGLLRRNAPFQLPDGSEISLPLGWPGAQAADVFDRYEPDATAHFADAITALPHPVTLIDCGADVGVFCRILLGKLTPDALDSLIAIEPNENSFPLLQQNLDRPDATLVFAAVSDRSGFGRLATPDYSDGDHAKFLEVSDTETNLPVVTIDEMGIQAGASIALKIDVEGAELDTLRGAEKTLRAAPGFAIQVEAHPDVAKRTGIDPLEFIKFAAAIRPCHRRAHVEKTRQTFEIADMETPFFEQLSPAHIYDIVITSA